jgi:hypothetical protein
MTPSELEAHFASLTLPETLRLTVGNKIVNVKGFVKSHLQVISNYKEGSGIYQAFYDRLVLVKEMLSKETA